MNPMDIVTPATSIILRLVARIIEGRSEEEAIRVLTKLAEEGTGPIQDGELAAQVAQVLAEYEQKE